MAQSSFSLASRTKVRRRDRTRRRPCLTVAAFQWPVHANDSSRRLSDVREGDLSSREVGARGMLLPFLMISNHNAYHGRLAIERE